MADINKVVLIGRLTRDCELKYTGQGQPVVKFSIAVNRSVKRGDNWEDEPNFFDVVLWGKRGESLNQYLTKGKQVGVEGELRQDRWQQDGQNRSKVEVVVSNVNLLGGSNGGGENRNSSGQSGSDYGGRQSAPSSQREETSPSDDSFADDIPF